MRFGNSPITHTIKESFFNFIKEKLEKKESFDIVGFEHEKDPETYGTHYTFEGFGDKWHLCEFRTEEKAIEWQKALAGDVEFVKVPATYHKGKERELDAARIAAVWMEATDEELCAPDLKEKLEARLPGLLLEFKKDVESLGLVY